MARFDARATVGDASDDTIPDMGRPGEMHQGLTELVRAELRRQILNGQRLPGGRLVEQDLAEELGVSRNPIRQALHLLSVEGFVDLLPRKGAVVASPTAEDIECVLEIRTALEVVAARGAAERRRQEDLDEMHRILEEADAAVEDRNFARLAELNYDFHDAVAKASHNPYLESALPPLRWKMLWNWRQTAEVRAEGSWAEHRKMAKAIARQDPDQAEELALHHMKRGMDISLSFVGKD